MPYRTDLADGLRAYGCTVVEHPGWTTAGSPDFNPLGVVCHHTASQPPANAPALGTVVNGRPDLPPPLANVVLARDGTAIVTAAGRANHAGSGSWQGLVGNSMVWGIEAENNGTGEVWTQRQLGEYVRVTAALLALSRRTDSSWACRHAEWAGPRKIDAWGPWFDGRRWERDAPLFRALVQTALNNNGDVYDMDTLGRWMQEQANRVIATLTAVVNGRQADGLYLVQPANKTARRRDGAWLWDGGPTCRHLSPSTGSIRLMVGPFRARRVRLSASDLRIFHTIAPPV